MLTTEVVFSRPASLSEAVAALQEDPGGTAVLAGGMSLVPQLNLGLVRPRRIVSLSALDELRGITTAGDQVRIGAMVVHRDVAASEALAGAAPVLAEAARRIGDVQVRNRGTIGGSIVQADPWADYLPALVVCRAEVELHGPNGTRRSPIGQFIHGRNRTGLVEGEMLTGVLLPSLPPHTSWSFVRLARAEGTPAVTTAAVLVFFSGDVHLAVGGPTCPPLEAAVAREALADGEPPQDLVAAMEAGTGDDPAGRYLAAMGTVAARRALAEALM